MKTDLGLSLESKSAEKELKATADKSKASVTTFTKKLVTTFQLPRTRSGHISLKQNWFKCKKSIFHASK